MQRMTSFLRQMYINCISANVRNAKSACSKCPPYAGFKYHGAIRNESVPKIIINNIVNYLFKTAISILEISNHNSSSIRA